MSCELQRYDLIVAGGGLSGIAAAVAAAREGSKVVLLERYGFLGGMATAGLVNPFMPYATETAKKVYDFTRLVNKGIFEDILQSLEGLGGLHTNRVTFNEEILKLILDRMMRQYNIDVLLHSFVSGVKREGNKIKSVCVASKSGVREYTAEYFVDATGDADLSALSGCENKIGRESDGFCQPMTLCFRLANVDKTKLAKDNSINSKYKELKKKGQIKNPRENVLMFYHMLDDAIHFNSTRVTGKLSVNVEEMTAAEMEAREQVYELYTFLRENIPGFENSQIMMTAPQTGVRESRRIVGEYTITQDDLLSVKKFEDSIARGNYPVDIHNPSGSGTVIRYIPYGEYYTIPYRALIPKGMENLIAAGRPISSTHEAHSAYRVMPICTCIGEGAGTAAAIAVKKGISFGKVDVDEIRRTLDKYDALY